MYQEEGQADEFYKKKPELSESQQRLLNAFYRLCTERNYVNSCPLSLKDSDIYHYAQRASCAGYPNDVFIECITEIDNHWLQRQAEKQKSKNQ